MTRQTTAFSVADLSAFARALNKALAEHQATHGGLPSHQAMLNHIARAAGHRNFQALLAHGQVKGPGPKGLPRLATPAEERAPLPSLSPTARKALQQFDTRGRLVRWPNKFSVQRLAMWVLWMQFDGRRSYTEREVNEVIKAWHTWGDHVTLRRELINDKLLTRKPDGSVYRKLPARPDPEARALMGAWRALVPRRGVNPSADATATR